MLRAVSMPVTLRWLRWFAGWSEMRSCGHGLGIAMVLKLSWPLRGVLRRPLGLVGDLGDIGSMSNSERSVPRRKREKSTRRVTTGTKRPAQQNWRVTRGQTSRYRWEGLGELKLSE